MLPLDLALFQAINADAATWPAVITAARWASQQLPLAMAGVLVGALATGGSRERSALAKAVASMALAWLAVQLLRHAVPAPRPAQLGIGIQWIEHAARATFPSMHAAGALALAASLQASRAPRTLVLPTWGVALAMGWSRICLGVHFPSDLLVGMLTGMLSACIVEAVTARAHRLAGARHQEAEAALSSPRRSSAYWCRPVRPWARRR